MTNNLIFDQSSEPETNRLWRLRQNMAGASAVVLEYSYDGISWHSAFYIRDDSIITQHGVEMLSDMYTFNIKISHPALDDEEEI